VSLFYLGFNYFMSVRRRWVPVWAPYQVYYDDDKYFVYWAFYCNYQCTKTFYNSSRRKVLPPPCPCLWAPITQLVEQLSSTPW